MDDQLELPDTSPRDARLAAMRLLTRREHSCWELTQKLQHKGFELALIAEIIREFKQQGIISDVRYAESYTRVRSARGYGPIRIAQELKQRGVDEEIRIATLADSELDWYELVQKVRTKRFGRALPQNITDKAKQTRFLEYRGFNQQQIKYALSADAELID